ncbi:hypothetical protein [Leptospira sp. id769339]|uniref:hypothetical protein n=1 Tax=Leptospira sp. id769339 TaxID=2864221 RepID=UPI00214A8CBF|nr:hypothetical protein [Leptospira sp. id769339]MCR1794232.1 hypothetical protein [Leptospira sp. id769339]
MRSRSFILITVLCSSLYYNCLSDKTCSDEDKSCSSQALLTSILSVPNGIYIYSTINTYQGNLAAYGSGPEIGGQNICKGEKLFSSLVNQFCPDVWAFISSESVPLFTFTNAFSVPSNLPIYGPTGILISDTWEDFVLGEVSPKQPLSSSGLGDGDFWTFSTIGGGLAGDNCNAGSDNTSEFFGAVGSPSTKNNDWINPGGESFSSCDSRYRVLCVCFTPVINSESQ